MEALQRSQSSFIAHYDTAEGIAEAISRFTALEADRLAPKKELLLKLANNKYYNGGKHCDLRRLSSCNVYKSFLFPQNFADGKWESDEGMHGFIGAVTSVPKSITPCARKEYKRWTKLAQEHVVDSEKRSAILHEVELVSMRWKEYFHVTKC